ncbi:OsmC family protein [Roseateles sp.]|uniref:OsmC family protein n=1 Tax=Roseateles sp. TaxID=1971397 RepID=UPI0039E74F45
MLKAQHDPHWPMMKNRRDLPPAPRLAPSARAAAPVGVTACWSAIEAGQAGEIQIPYGETFVQVPATRPHDLLDAALAASTLDLLLVARQEHLLPISAIRVDVSHEFAGARCRMTRTIDVTGSLTARELNRMLALVDQTPIQLLLADQVDVLTFAQQRQEPVAGVGDN